MVELVTGSQNHHKTAGIGENGQSLVYRRSSDRMAGSVPVWENNARINNAKDISFAKNISAPNSAKSAATPPSLGFGEILDIINPLHHLPIVGGIYRQMTGDTISPVARIAGGALFGGPIGAVAALANAAIEEHSGQDFTGNVVSAFNGSSSASNRNADKTAWEDERMAGSRRNGHKQDTDMAKDETKSVETTLAENSAVTLGQVWKFNT